MIGHASGFFERVIFLFGEGNLRSRRAMKKITAVLTDRIGETQLGEGALRHVVFAIDREQFARGPLASSQ